MTIQRLATFRALARSLLTRTALRGLAAGLLAAGCASSAADAPADRLPAPYSADELRAANPEGTELIFRLREPGGPWLIQMMRFVQADAQGATIETYRTDAAGELPDEAMSVDVASWRELRDHASFPRVGTARRRSDCVVPAGKFDCWLYTVVDADNDLTSHFYFADGRPGPPVRWSTLVGGRTTLEMELVEVRRP